MARTTRSIPAPQNDPEHIEEVPNSQSDVGQASRAVTKASAKTKRTRDAADKVPVIDPEQSAPSKRARTATKENLIIPQAEPAATGTARRSIRNNTKVPTTAPKRKRRTKAQIAADNAAAEIEKTRLKELEEEKRDRMARMDLEDDVNRMEADARTIRKISDLDQHPVSSEEEFAGYNDVVPDSSSESETDLAEPKDGSVNDFQALKRNHKALQEELKTLKARVGGGRKKSVGGKKTKHVAFASGLRSDWNSQAGAVKKAPKKRPHVEVISGGLRDSDIDDASTAREGSSSNRMTAAEMELALEDGSKRAKRDSSRQNQLVTIVSDDSDSEEDFTPQPRPQLPKPSAKKIVKTRKVKNEPKENPLQAVPKAAAANTKIRRLNANNVRISDLIDFMKPEWRTSILPTIYDKFLTSSEPFSQFFKGSDAFVALLQTVIDEVFPNTTYKVKADDALHHLAYNRINEKRSHIGAAAIEAIKRHISAITVHGGGEKAAREWIRWAMRSDGPLFFKVPAPMNSPTDRANPSYKHPEGRLLSQFIIDLAGPPLRLKKGSVSENGYPRGLFALILAALERAVRSFLKPSNEIKEFSNEFWGSKVTIYHSSLHAIEEARWKEIFDACGLGGTAENLDDENLNDADLSLLDNNRAFLFDFASPTKRRA